MRHSLGGSLRHHRAVLGLTQNALARRAGISQAYLSQVEAERRVRVSASILQQLADALGATVTDLMGKEALATQHARRSEAWLYQMRQRPEWGPLDYARDVREGRLLAGHWNEAPPSKIHRLGGRFPAPGDLIILIWARTDIDRPGIAGFGVITDFDAQRRLRFRALPPTRTLQSTPRSSPAVQGLVEGIRTEAEGPMWRISDAAHLRGMLAEVFAELRDRWLADWSQRGSQPSRRASATLQRGTSRVRRAVGRSE